MDDRLKQILNKHEDKFFDWIDNINANGRMWFTNEKIDDKQHFDINHKTVTTLSEIAGMFYQYGNFKEEFENDNYYLHLYGPELIINAKKTKTNIRFGINQNGLYLTSYFRHVEHLKSMDDKFWIDILKLSEYGQFEMTNFDWSRSNIKSKHPELCYNHKSVLFKIFRSYFFQMMEYDGNMDNFGDFTISWSPDNYFENNIAEACEVFKLFYKLDYSLWKIEDLKQKEIVKKANRQ